MRLLNKNRKAAFDYEIIEKFIAGVSLLGAETKSIMLGKCSLAEGYVAIKQKEAYLKQVHVDRYAMIDGFDSKINETRDRKLLLTKPELKKLEKAVTEKGLTIIPLAMLYSDSKKIKIEIAICRGKKTHDKRNALKEKALDRDAKRTTKI
jgi:SsrA-binding protein